MLRELSVLGVRDRHGPTDSPRVGESVEVQYFAPDGGVQIVLASAPRCKWTPARPSHCDHVEMTARFVGDLRVAAGERFQLDADVSRLWSIDAVETDPAGGVRNWDFQQDAAGGGKLTVWLAWSSPSRRSGCWSPLATFTRLWARVEHKT